MYAYDYYTTANGEQPLRAWLNSLQMKEWAVISAKIEKLGQEGLKLLQTNMMKTIENYHPVFYELIGGQIRVGVYFDQDRNLFILLHGWRKHKQRQPQDVQRAYLNLMEYLEIRSQ